MDKIFILVLNFKGADNTIECVRSLDKSSKIDSAEIETIIIDNGSNDGSLEKFKKTYPKLK